MIYTQRFFRSFLCCLKEVIETGGHLKWKREHQWHTIPPWSTTFLLHLLSGRTRGGQETKALQINCRQTEERLTVSSAVFCMLSLLQWNWVSNSEIILTKRKEELRFRAEKERCSGNFVPFYECRSHDINGWEARDSKSERKVDIYYTTSRDRPEGILRWEWEEDQRFRKKCRKRKWMGNQKRREKKQMINQLLPHDVLLRADSRYDSPLVINIGLLSLLLSSPKEQVYRWCPPFCCLVVVEKKMQYSTGVILNCISVQSLKYSFCLTLYFFVLESPQRKIEEKERTFKFLFFSSDFSCCCCFLFIDA